MKIKSYVIGAAIALTAIVSPAVAGGERGLEAQDFTFAAAFLLSGPALADEAKPDDPSKPVPLTAAQMDQVTGSGLFLPNMKEVFAGFDNPAPFDFHPNFDRESGGGARSTTAAAFNDGAGGGVTAFKGPVNGLFGNEGPWSAHFASPVISCIGC